MFINTAGICPKVMPPKAAPKPIFTADWLSNNVPIWRKHLQCFAGRPTSALEVGVFEGRSTLWLLQEILTHPSSRIDVVDTFNGAGSGLESQSGGLKSRFIKNVEPFLSKITIYEDRSQNVLLKLHKSFDIIYIDGSHDYDDVYLDAVNGWRLLNKKGIMIFDDYEYGWDNFGPKRAISQFLSERQGQFVVLIKGWQVLIRKV